MTTPGYVYLVGAGPGDPGLLTLKGRDCLAKADIVLYDGLVNPLLLRHTSAACEKAGRTDDRGVRRVLQEDINARLVAEAKAGKTVVRLKGGDPFIFGRGSEEAVALREAGIDYEVVPGVTAATTAGGYAGFPLTHRGAASAVALVTGHEDPGKDASDLDYPALAAFPGTLVFYMGLHRLPKIAAALIEAGKPADTPAAVVSKASTPRQRTVTATLARLPDAVREGGLVAPSLIVVGECVTLRERIAWFERRPLFGVRVGVARPAGRVDGTADAVLALGGEPVPLPTAELRPASGEDLLDAARRVGEFTHLAFTSSAAVGPFFDALRSVGGDSRSLAGVRTACVGPSTAATLAAYGLRCDVLPDEANAASLAAAISAETSQPAVLWPRSDIGRESLPDAIREGGGRVVDAVAYRNVAIPEWPAETVARLREGINVVLVGSPSAARAVAARWPGDASRPLALAGSEDVAATLVETGWPRVRTAESPVFEEMLRGLPSAIGESGVAGIGG